MVRWSLLAPMIVAQTVPQLRAGVTFEPGEIVGPNAGFAVLAGFAIAVPVRLMRPLDLSHRAL